MEIPARNVDKTAYLVFLRILLTTPGASMTDVCNLYESIF